MGTLAHRWEARGLAGSTCPSWTTRPLDDAFRAGPGPGCCPSCSPPAAGGATWPSTATGERSHPGWRAAPLLMSQGQLPAGRPWPVHPGPGGPCAHPGCATATGLRTPDGGLSGPTEALLPPLALVGETPADVFSNLCSWSTDRRRKEPVGKQQGDRVMRQVARGSGPGRCPGSS